MADRAQVTEFIVNAVDEILPDGFNKQRTADYLNSMDDEAFASFMQRLSTEEERLSVIAPNNGKVKLSVERNLKIAKKYDIALFERIWLPSPDGKGHYLSHDKYMIVRLPIKRQAQILTKKISIPEDNDTIDAFTHQAAGDAKSAKISYPEVQTIAAQGLVSTLEEFLKYRGGDLKGFNVMNTAIDRTGGVSLKAIEPYSGKVKATQTLSAYLTAMHLRNNL